MNEPIRTIIVDDEPNSRDMLEFLLKSISNVKVLDKCSNITEAFDSIVKHDPEIVFLDIEMPGGSGFDLIQKLRKTEYSPTIIFVTAYNQFAIKAIKHAAFDYLLKPIDIDDLNDSINRYKAIRNGTKDKHTEHAKVDKLIDQLTEFQKLKFNMRNGVLFVDPDEIIWCEASGSYTILHFHTRKDEVVSVSLKEIEQQLTNMPFYRISRSAIINLRYLTRIDRRNKICVVQKDNLIFKITGSPQHLKVLENQ